MGGSVQTFHPVGRWHAGLEEEGAKNVVDAPDHTLGMTVLWRGVWAGHPQVHHLGEEKCAGAGVIELAAIVALHGLHCGAKLSTHK